MIAQRLREGRRSKALKLAKLYKEGKCRECSVVVTRMDFAKILGKHTKVKIQYESSTPKTQKTTRPATPKSNGRLKNNENGMIQGLRSRSNVTPSKPIQRPRILKSKEASSPKQQKNNILKENNVLKKTTTSTDKKIESKSLNNKKYGIIFSHPKNNSRNEYKSKSSLKDLLPKVNTSLLPSSEWCIDYYPKLQETKDSKVYDRIAAELEDLMNSEKPQVQNQDKVVSSDDSKVDEFPSIMDILNDNTTVSTTEQKDQSSIDFKGSLYPSTTLDVEAMLLGKPEDPVKVTPMDIDTSVIDKNLPENSSFDDNPGSPSILNDTSTEEKLLLSKDSNEKSTKNLANIDSQNKPPADSDSINNKNKSILNSQDAVVKSSFNLPTSKLDSILYLTFKKIVDGKCLKSVKCPKNLKFNIELDQKSVELIGAPKFISTIDDLQVLLQIVNESDPTSSYIQCL
ncbi:uncharacterized protein LOC121734614 [Aricia agestis]|uniref:uncharacterized protein LOC121734614 n=1 Tax=Aricia agestis TaxID=91739 RepID=UPI001C2025A4|nr:uncharacterized protein LOC121734614 [Aricia agestis]